MQKLAREYLDELNKRHKKNRRALVAWILMAVLVVGGVMGTLAQYGVAFEGSPECGKEAHTHDDGCYTETQELICDLTEGEEHTHDDACYTVSKELTCELEEHTHGDECVKEPEGTEAPRPEETTTAPADDNTEPEGTEGTAAETETQPATEDESTDSEETTESETEIETETEPESEETLPAEFEATEKIDGGKVEIHVTAGEGVLPEDAQLKAVPVVKQDIEKLKKKDGVTSEEIEAAKEINEKYDAVSPALEKTIPEDEIKKIAGFTAYDISFLAPDEDGEMTEFEPQGEVGVEIKFTQAFLPESVADHEGIEITDVNLVHMRESGKELIAETMEDAEFVLTEDSEIKNASFTSEDFSIYAVAWTRGPQKLEYEDDDVIISVEEAEIGNIPEGATLNVVPVVEENEETEEQYKTIEEKLKENAAEENGTIAGFVAYDLSFTDQDDVDVEPEGRVKVTVEYKEAIAPEAIVPEITAVSVVMLNLDETETTEKTEDPDKAEMQTMANTTESAVQFATEPTIMEVTESKELRKTEVVTDSLMPMAMVWNEQIHISNIEIEDDIIENGCLRVKLPDAEQNVIDQIIEQKKQEAVNNETEFESKDIVHYVWKKQVNDGNWVDVLRTRVGTEYNIAEDGSWLNVVLDDGALNDGQKKVIYTVEAYIGDSETPTNKVDDRDAYSVPYWNELRNGSFEEPIVDGIGDGNPLFGCGQFSVGTSGLIWKTTGLNPLYEEGWDPPEWKYDAIEIVNPFVPSGMHSRYNWYGDIEVPEGKQFAELNCESVGALYQDVLTIPGERLNYWLYHRARGKHPNDTPESDSMYVVIAPVSLAKNGINGDGNEIDTQQEVESLIAEQEKNPEKLKGVYVMPYSSDDQEWYFYDGTYIPTSYATRFFFVADTTATNSASEGNFLDNVGFGQSLPPAKPGKFDLRITKEIKGIALDGLELGDNLSDNEISRRIEEKIKEKFSGIRFEIRATDQQGNDIPDAPCVSKIDEKTGQGGLSITDSGWEWTVNDEGNYIGVYRFTDNEIEAEKSLRYFVTESGGEIDAYTLQSELEIRGGVVKKDANGKDISTILKEKDSVNFSFTNTYIPNLKLQLQIEKSIEGLDGEKLKQLQNGLRFDVELVGDGPDGALIKYENVKLEFDSSGKGTYIVENVLPGRTYKITEKNAAVFGYELRATSNNVDLPKDSEENTWRDIAIPSLSEISQNPENAVIIVQFKNIYRQDETTIDLLKYGSSYDMDCLPGARFSLYVKNPISNTKEIEWTLLDSYQDFTVSDKGEAELHLADGSYKLVEIEAPGSYQLLKEDIYFKIESNEVTLIDEKGGPIASDSKEMWKLDVSDLEDEKVYILSILNEALYELPSTGGSGIYRYMISGVLLMMAGVLILYNNKRARRCAGV